MTSSRKGLVRRQVFPRLGEVLRHPNFVVSVSVGIATFIVTWLADLSAPYPVIAFKDLTGATLTFAGISFGGAVAGATLALSLPASTLFYNMVLNSTRGGGTRRQWTGDSIAIAGPQGVHEHKAHEFEPSFISLYSELIFVFLLTAFAQLALAVSSVGCLVMLGNSQVNPPEGWLPRAALAVLLMTFTYAVLQMYATLKAVFNVAELRDKYERNNLVQRSLAKSGVDHNGEDGA